MRSNANNLTTGADPKLTDLEFARLTALLTRRTGMLFPEHKRRDFETKLSPHLESMDPSLRASLVDRVETDDAVLQNLVNQLTIGESYFFRNRPHFTALEERILPDIIKANSTTRRLRIWCAGCSTGEEPYSLSILMRERFPELAGWDVLIEATDINTSFLDRARRGVYTNWSFRSVEPRIISRYFTKEDVNRYVLSREITGTVDFGTFNLSKPPFRGRLKGEPFDLVMCRNVLIYFSYEASNSIIGALADMIKPGGYLIVGHAESFPALRELEAIYAHATYYYQKSTGRRHSSISAQPVHTVSIPGIGVHEVERRSSTLYPRISTLQPSRTLDLEEVAVQAGEDEGDLLAIELETAQDHTDMGELGKAKTILDRLVEGPGKLHHRVHFLRALIADQENRTQEAMASLKQSIFLNKQFAIGHYYHGVICEREGDRLAAARYFRNVCGIARSLPDDSELDEGGGMTAGVLREIAEERIKEVSLEQGGSV